MLFFLLLYKFLLRLECVIGENSKCLRFVPGKVDRNAVYEFILLLYPTNAYYEGRRLLLLISLGQL